MPIIADRVRRGARTHSLPNDTAPTVLDGFDVATLDAIASNIIIADPSLTIVFANRAAQDTLASIAPALRESFGIEPTDIVGGSIHRFHRDPQRIERILERPDVLPHRAEFTFGETTLAATIDAIRGQDGHVRGFLVDWDDVSERVKLEAEVGRITSMMEQAPTNMMFADTDLVLRYMNPASLSKLRELEQYLPVPADELVGQSIDIFHRKPTHQRQVLGDPNNLPWQASIKVGPERLSLLVSPIRDAAGRHIGAMASWEVVTEQHDLMADLHDSTEALSESTAMLTQISDELTTAFEVTETMQSLQAASEEIGGIIKVITSIADQTNMLALNATIEAARAGSAGAGFAVVADEVKGLAAQTAQAAEQVAQRVTGIRAQADAASDGILSLAPVVDRVREIQQTLTSAVGSTDQIASRIAAAVTAESGRITS